MRGGAEQSGVSGEVSGKRGAQAGKSFVQVGLQIFHVFQAYGVAHKRAVVLVPYGGDAVERRALGMAVFHQAVVAAPACAYAEHPVPVEHGGHGFAIHFRQRHGKERVHRPV